MVTLQEIKSNLLVNGFIETGNKHLAEMGFTDHGKMHLSVVSRVSQDIMLKLGYDERTAELAGIAAYMHDIGNVINRNGHSQSGSIMALEILRRAGMDPREISLITAAIGNHDEGSGHPVNEVAAALILADKSHVHRNRVRNQDVATFDIHDRVNFAVQKSNLIVDGGKRVITMDLTIDTNICPVMEYFEIFLSRMLMCQKAADYFDCEFGLIINGAKLL
ncbi:MAG: HD domain-containing protein [Syntrophomonadaceae bacterium]|nr:HD domain-containing protein [Syntrophomonadaceae bacterium]